MAKSYEKSAADRKADKAGRHGKEGSAKDRRMDKAKGKRK